MKPLTLLLLITSFSFAQIGIGTTTPTGALDISSSLATPSIHKAGLVPPIVALTATNSFATTTPSSNIINPNSGGTPIVGTIVYNTNTSAVGANQVTPGYYFYNGTIWEKLTSGATTNWSLSGNAGTTPTTNFVGTTDNQDLRLRTNNAERVIVSAAGNVGIGIAPTSKFHIYEATGTIPTATTGTLVLDHGNTGGGSSIVFPSRVNNGSDYGYIRYDDDTSGNGSTAENALLEIGVQNDVLGVYQDDIAIMPSGNFGVDTRAPKAKFHNNGTTAFTIGNNTTTDKTILLLNANFTLPTPSVDNNGVIYILRNINTSAINIGPFIDYGATTANTISVTSSITVVCNGISWYRID